MIRALIVSMGLLAAGTLVGATAVKSQTQQGADQTTASGASTSVGPDTPKPKKFWKNDDMNEVTGTISVVGKATPPPRPAPATPQGAPGVSSMRPGAAAPTTKPATDKTATAKSSGDTVDPKVLAQTREQLQKLQAGIDQLDKQIAQLKDADHGNSKNMGVLTSDPSQYSMEPVPDQIKALDAKKASLQAAMDQLVDAARATGIEPGQLR